MTVKKEVATSSVATTFLNKLQALTSGYIILCEGKEKLQTFKKYAESCTPDSSVNTYYTVNPRHKLPVNGAGKLTGQGTKDHIKEVIAFYADVEAGQDGHKKASFYATKEEALQAIRSFKYRPSFIIDSGHGYHCLWLFKEPYMLGEDVDLEYYEAMNRGIQKVLKADTTADVTRILRVPGSFNVKDPAHPVKCEMVDSSGARYNLEDFEDYITPVLLDAAAVDFNLKLEAVKTSRKNLSPRINKIIGEGVDPSDSSNTDRSSLIQTAVDAMVAKGFTDNEIYTVLTDRSLKISEKILTEKKTEMERKRYIALSISKAKGFIQVQQKEAEATTEEMKTGLTVLGYTKDHKVMFWHRGTIQEFELKRITPDDLCLLTGKDEMTKETFNELKKYIRQQCNFKGIIKESCRMRNGVWKLKNRFVIVSGEDILEVKDMEICKLDTPVVDGRIVEFEEKWLNFEIFQQVFKEASLDEVYQELTDYIGKWHWRDPEMVGYMTSFVMLAAFQQAMKWRPWLYLHAQHGSGKTLFFDELIQRLYGQLTVRLDSPSFMGIAQTLDGTGRIALLDNYEAGHKTSNILEGLQSTNRGAGVVVRGTPSGKARRHNLHHMLFLSGVAPASKSSGASDSRTVQFGLNRFASKSDRSIQSIPEKKAELLLAKLLASMLRNWQAIDENANKYVDKYNKREAENIAYAMAIQEIISEKEVDELPKFVEEREIINDEENLLTAILTSNVIADGESEKEVHKRPVYEILSYGGSIEAKGVKVVTKKDKSQYISIYPPLVKRYMLQDMQEYRGYHHKNIEDMLLNIVGAKKEYQKIDKSTKYTVLIPYSYLEPFLRDDYSE